MSTPGGADSAGWQPEGAARYGDRLIAYLDTMAGSDYGRRVAETSLAMMAIEPGQRLIEVGCGSGVLLPTLAEAVGPSGHVVAVDHAATFLAEARARVEAAGLGDRVTLREADAHHLPFDDGSFDAAHCERLLLHVDDPTAVLREMARVVRPGGWVVAAETDWLSGRMDHPDVETRDLIFAAKYASIRNPGVGLELYRRMDDAGLVERRAIPMPLLVTDYRRLEPMIQLRKAAEDLVAAGRLDAARADSFFDSLHDASERGRYLGHSSGIIITVGRVPSAVG